MSLSVRLNGQVYGDFISASAVKSIETLSGAFAFKSSANAQNLFPVKVDDSVEILADAQVFITGSVEKLSVSYGSDGHSITISGRDKLGDLLDSSVVKVREFTGAISLQSVIRQTLDDLGLTSIKIINNAGTIEDFGETEITSAEVGQNAFEFIELYARKRQVLLTSDGQSNLIMARGGKTRFPAKLQHIVNSDENNIKSATMTQDHASRFNQYVVFSELNPIYQDEGQTAEDMSSQGGKATDSAIRKTRILQMMAEESMDSFTAVDRAKWESNIRRARAFDYSCVVQGHTSNGEAWMPNFLVPIVDQFCNISSDLLLRQVEMNYDLDSGSTTTLSFAKKDAYTLQAEEDQRQASTTKQGDEFEL